MEKTQPEQDLQQVTESDNDLDWTDPEQLLASMWDDTYKESASRLSTGNEVHCKSVIDDHVHLQCEACQGFFPCIFPDSNHPHIDGGSTVTMSSPQYAGFNDDCESPSPSAVLCHDCTLKIYRMIPKLRGLTGLHPVDCCTGKEYQQGMIYQNSTKERYAKVFNDLFGPFSDSDEVEWPFFDHSDTNRTAGGCEWSW